MVPGQRDGENKKEQLAVVRQPRARPALLSLRRDVGDEKRRDAAIAATVKVVRMIVEVEIIGGEEISIEENIVKKARSMPDASVEVALPGVVVKGDVVDALIVSDRNRDQGAELDVGEPAFEGGRDTLDRGGWRKRTEVAKAIYPRTTFFRGV